jgi:hypothetical protein
VEVEIWTARFFSFLSGSSGSGCDFIQHTIYGFNHNHADQSSTAHCMHHWTCGLTRFGELWECAFGTGETARVEYIFPFDILVRS